MQQGAVQGEGRLPARHPAEEDPLPHLAVSEGESIAPPHFLQDKVLLFLFTCRHLSTMVFKIKAISLKCQHSAVVICRCFSVEWCEAHELEFKVCICFFFYLFAIKIGCYIFLFDYFKKIFSLLLLPNKTRHFHLQ